MNTFLYSWGSNGECQLGLGGESNIVEDPSQAIGYPRRLHQRITSLQAGANHTLIRSEHGTVFAAGDNTDRQLGYRPGRTHTTVEDRLPYFHRRYRNIDFVAATATSTAYIVNPGNKHNRTRQAMIITEGTGKFGELCRGKEETTAHMDAAYTDTIWDSEQFDVTTVANYLPGKVEDFAAGLHHYVAVMRNGDVYGWGKSQNGQLGEMLDQSTRKDTKSYNYPTKLDVPFRAVRAVCGKDFTYVIGDPKEGVHIVFAKETSKVRKDMPLQGHVKDWKDIGATWQDLFVLDKQGAILSWGPARNWQSVPDNLPPIKKMAVGSAHVLALTRDGRLLAWGWATHGNCGPTRNMNKAGFISNTWHDFQLQGAVVDIGAGFATSFALIEEDRDVADEVGEVEESTDTS
ncbi:RCC1/BLIP-II [Amniculicola lignicola CBS 123094]|uniref:RCC1/BLIP-II n=1 Tax=Amniculicola lignicola CBS 123094 TaxID=1392246 RepID=A0A6A5X0P1_9PLEO|nr:RCC1/BLIP-II [Amniculicola lignicola CBS 123094]